MRLPTRPPLLTYLLTGFKRKLSELIPQRSVLEEQREAVTLRNVEEDWRTCSHAQGERCP